MSNIFGGNTGLTYEQAKRLRERAQAMRGGGQRPQTVGQGLSALGEGLASGLMERRANKAIGEKEKEGNALRESLWARLGGSGGGQRRGTDFNPAASQPRQTPAQSRGLDMGRDPSQAPARSDRMVESGGVQYDTGRTNPWAGKEDIQAGIFAGESGGDYDAVFGYANREGGRYEGVKPTEMTVGEVLQFQDPQGDYGQWVKGQVGRVATPVGAYQVVGTTLRDAVQNGVVDPGERFTSDVQDRVGEWVLSTQGTGAWEGYQGPRSGEQPRQGGNQGTRVAGGGDEIVTDILRTMKHPTTSDEERSVLGMLLEQKLQQQDPMRQMEMELAQLELEQMRNPPDSERKIIKGVDGRNYYQDTQEPVLPNVQAQPGARPITPQERAQWGIPDDGRPWSMTPDGPEQLGSSPLVENNVGNEQPPPDAALREKLTENQGKSWSNIIDAGTSAARAAPDLEALRELAKAAPSGPLRGRLAEMFPEYNDVTAAREAIIKRVAPTLRVEGSGSTSDVEYAGMVQGMGRLTNSPEANVAISDMMIAKADLDRRRADAVRAYQIGDASYEDTVSTLSELDQVSIMPDSLKRMLPGSGEPQSQGGGPKRLHFNPETGDLE